MAVTNYIQWNVVNWITILVMVAIGMVIVQMGSSLLRQGLPSFGPVNTAATGS
jgi:hypothetical protein